jgi:hypothetical protein
MDDLLALAESLNLDEGDLDDFSGQEIVRQSSESQPVKWRCPPILDVERNSQGIDHGSLFDTPDTFVEPAARNSPHSPTQRNRVSLFGDSDVPKDLLTSTEFIDPRGLYILDHPGRNAQFKHWLSGGLITDDSRRATFREESAEVGCWQKVATEDEDRNSNNIFNLIRVVRPEDGDAIKKESRVVTASPIVSVNHLQSQRSSQSRDLWEARSFMVGGSIMVAMAHMDFDDSIMVSWCAWFNDRLCSWGINERSAPALDQRSNVNVIADLDFSSNHLTEKSVRELVRLLGAFKRIQVGTLRLSSNSLSRNVLDELKSLPYIRYLVLDDNRFASDDLCEWIPEMLLLKQELYDILVAQDMPDENVKQALFVSIERNGIFHPMELIERLHAKNILVCLPESSGCEPNALCRLYGPSCAVHLAGLSSQKDTRYI